MHSDTVYTKTAKGILEIKNKTVRLPRDIGLVFLSVDGKATVGNLESRSGMPAPKLHQVLEKLLADGYIKTFGASGASSVPATQGDADLDFTSPQALAKLNMEAATRSLAESDANARATDERRAALDARLRQESEARARALAEMRAQTEADAKTKAEEAARAAAEERSRAEIDLNSAPDAEARAQAESRMRAAATAVARAKAEARSRGEAEERARALAETKKAAEEAAREEAEIRAKAGDDAQALAAAEARAREALEEKIRKLAAPDTEPLPALIEHETPPLPVVDLFEAQQHAARLREAAEAERREREPAEPAFELEPRAQALQARVQAEMRGREEAAQTKSAAAADTAKEAAKPAATRLPALDIDGGDARRAAPLRPPPAFEPMTVAPTGLAKAMADAAARAEGKTEPRAPEPEIEEVPVAERASDDRAAHDVFSEQERMRQRADAAEKSRALQRERRLQEESRRSAIFERLRRRRAVIRTTIVSIIVILAGITSVLQFTPFNSFIPDAQQKISARLGEPVTIASLRYPLLPTPRLVLDGVVIGNEGVKIDTLTVAALPFSLLGSTHVGTVEGSGVTIDPDMLAAIPAWAAAPGAGVRMDRLVLTAVQVKPMRPDLGAFDAEAAFSPDGSLQDARLGNDKVMLVLVPVQNAVRVTLSAHDWRPPIGPAIDFTYLDLTALVDARQIVVNDLHGRIAGGMLKATIAAKWSGPISMDGEFTTDNVRLEELMPAFTPYFPARGLLKANGRYALQSNSLEGLFTAPRVQATFAIARGELKEIDLVRTIQASAGSAFRGGRTPFDDLSGSVQVAGGRYSYRPMQITSGPLNANGAVEIGPAGELSGQLSAEVGSKGRIIARSTLTLAGTLKDPQIRH